MTIKQYIAVPRGLQADLPLLVEGESIEDAREVANAYRRSAGRSNSYLLVYPAVALTRDGVKGVKEWPGDRPCGYCPGTMGAHQSECLVGAADQRLEDQNA